MTADDGKPPGIETKRVQTTAAFFDSLRSESLEVRLATLKAIAQAPEKALLFGSYQGRDAIDELSYQLTVSPNISLRCSLFAALVAFDDPRVTVCARNIFASDKEPFLVVAAARRLRLEPEKTVIAYFERFLYDAPTSLHAKEAGRAVMLCPAIEDQVKLRAALLAGDEALSPPPLTPDTFALWKVELEGPLADKANGFLITQGKSAFDTLKDQWHTLSDSNRIWILNWGAETFPAESVALVLQALGAESEQVVTAGLVAIATHYGDCKRLFKDVLDKFSIETRGSAFVHAAIRAGVPIGNQWSQLYLHGDMPTKIALIERMGEEKASGRTEQLLSLLEDDNWRIRSVARDALIRCGDISVNQLSLLAQSEKPFLKSAAVQILLQMGEDDLLHKIVKSV